MSLSPKVVRQTLHFFGDTNLGEDGGGFVTRLFQLIAVADEENRAKLADIFPEHVAAFVVAGTTPWGIEWLRALSKSMELGDVEALDMFVDGVA